MRGKQLIENWNSEKKFILGMHRYGNNSEGLGQVKELSRKTSGKFAIALECDLKWLKTDKYYLYLYHGILIPGTKNDLIKTEKDLLKKEKAGEIILLENVLQECPQLYYMVHIKYGIGKPQEALEKVAQLFKECNTKDKYFGFANSLMGVAWMQKTLPDVPMGCIHHLRVGDRWLHSPDYDLGYNFAKYGIFPRLDKSFCDFIITTENQVNKGFLQSDMAYFSHAVRDKETLRKAITNGAMGAFIYCTVEELLDIL